MPLDNIAQKQHVHVSLQELTPIRQGQALRFRKSARFEIVGEPASHQSLLPCREPVDGFRQFEIVMPEVFPETGWMGTSQPRPRMELAISRLSNLAEEPDKNNSPTPSSRSRLAKRSQPGMS